MKAKETGNDTFTTKDLILLELPLIIDKTFKRLYGSMPAKVKMAKSKNNTTEFYESSTHTKVKTEDWRFCILGTMCTIIWISMYFSIFPLLSVSPSSNNVVINGTSTIEGHHAFWLDNLLTRFALITSFFIMVIRTNQNCKVSKLQNTILDNLLNTSAIVYDLKMKKKIIRNIVKWFIPLAIINIYFTYPAIEMFIRQFPVEYKNKSFWLIIFLAFPNRMQGSAMALHLTWIHLTIGFMFMALNQSLENLLYIPQLRGKSQLQFYKNAKEYGLGHEIWHRLESIKMQHTILNNILREFHLINSTASFALIAWIISNMVNTIILLSKRKLDFASLIITSTDWNLIFIYNLFLITIATDFCSTQAKRSVYILSGKAADHFVGKTKEKAQQLLRRAMIYNPTFCICGIINVNIKMAFTIMLWNTSLCTVLIEMLYEA